MEFDLTESKAHDAIAALLFMGAINMVFQAYGTLNSSPWTAESFGADHRRAAAMREYVWHAVAFSMAMAVLAAWVAQGRKATMMILFGAVTANGYLVWLYFRASRRGLEAGSANWVLSGDSGGKLEPSWRGQPS